MALSAFNPDECFEMISPDQIKAREEDFEKMNPEELSPDELYQELMFVVSRRKDKSIPLGDTVPTETRSVMPGTFLWRGRTLSADDHVLPLRGMNSIADAWEPPPSKVRSAGRLNKVGESLLYTSYGNPLAVPDEIRVGDNEYFALIKYEVTCEVKLTAIGLPLSTDHLSPAAAAGAASISNFFCRQFSRRATLSDGIVYQISELIAKYNFDLPPEFHHGWIYPSVERAGAYNVTLRPSEAHSRLRLIGVAVCKAVSSDADLRLSGYAYSDGTVSPSGFSWHTTGSDVQLLHFPEFG